MCGIGGAFGDPDRDVLLRMNRLQHHRGPDESDVWMDDFLGFAHTRLAILDLASSQQPLQSPQGAVLVVNGEIYNYRSLRALHPEYPYSTNGDSEAILALHASATKRSSRPLSAKDHADWIGQLDGMYAVALWDPQHQQLVLARDPMGIKPLHRTMVDETLLFASEIKAFHADERYTPQLDPLAMSARLIWEYPLDATTLLKGVHQVRPGTVECWTLDSNGHPLLEGAANIERQRLNPAATWDPDEQAQPLLNTLVNGVQQRLMADVPVGIVLSGGLDSSLVAAVAGQAAQKAGQPVPECWTVAESEDNPDWKAAEAVASQLDLVHHQHLLSEGDFERHLPSLVWHGEDADVTVMFFHPLFQHMASKVKVGLCGQGADELHAGYPRYAHLEQHRRTLKARLDTLPSNLTNQLKAGPLTQSEGWYQGTHSVEGPTNDLESMLNFELEHGQLSNFQLRLVDRHSMAHSLEVRVPFLGKEHRRAANSLPMNWKLGGEEKAALRRAADLTDLPKDIVRRPKLPAGRATSPSMLQRFLDEHASQTSALLERYSDWSGALRGQEELALGLGLFEALHLSKEGYQRRLTSLDVLLDEVIAG